MAIKINPRKIKYDSIDHKIMEYVTEHKDEELRALQIVRGIFGENYLTCQKTKTLGRLKLLGMADFLDVEIDLYNTRIKLGSRPWKE